MAGSPVAVRLWWRGRPIELVSKVEAMGGDERSGGGGGGWVQVFEEDGFSTSVLMSSDGEQLIRLAADVGNHLMTNHNLIYVSTIH